MDKNLMAMYLVFGFLGVIVIGLIISFILDKQRTAALKRMAEWKEFSFSKKPTDKD